LAIEVGVMMIDIEDLTANEPKWFLDGIHPNAVGDVAIAKKLQQNLPL